MEHEGSPAREEGRAARWKAVASSTAARYALAAAATGVAFAPKMALADSFGPPYILFYPAVMLVATLGGLGPGLLATAMSVSLVAFRVLPAELQSRPMTARDAVSLAAFAGMGVFMSAVAALYRRARLRVAGHERARAVREAEERSRAREEGALRRYELLAASSRDILLFIRRADGRILEANAAAAAAYGYPREALRELTVDALRAPGTQALTELQRARADEHGLRFEALHRRRDGTTFPVEVDARGATIDGERLLVGAIRDITDRRRSDEDLREAQRLAHVGSWRWDARTDAAAGSEELLRIFGLDPARPMPPFREQETRLYPAESLRRLEAARREAMRTGVDFSLDLEARRAGGEPLWVTVRGEVARDAGGAVVGMRGSVQDITERRRSLEKLAAERERLAVTLRCIGDAVIATDVEARVTDFNAVAEALTGWKSEEALGRPLDEVFHLVGEETRQPVANPAEALLREGAPAGRADHAALLARDGTVRPIAVSGAPIRDASGRGSGAVLVFRDQTEERRAEHALRESEARYRAIFEQAAVGVALIEAGTGRLLQVNARFCEMLGYAREELLGATWEDFTHPDDLEASRASLRRMEATSVPYQREKRYLRKDGAVVWGSLTVSPVALPGQAQTRRVAIVEDITERKRAEEAVLSRRALEDQLARIAASVPGVLFSFLLRRDGSTSIPFATPAVEELFGIPKEALARDTAAWAANVHPDDLPRVNAGVLEAARDLTRWHDAYRYRHPTRGQRWIEGWSVPRREVDGCVVWHGYLADVTDHRLAEEALRESEARFRAIFEQAAVGMGQVDARTGRFVRVNDKLCAIVGYSREELLALEWQQLTHPDDLAESQVRYARLLAKHGSYSRLKRYVRKDGAPVWVELAVSPMWSAGEAPTSHVSVIQDITGRKRAEEALLKSEERFRVLIEKASDILVVLDGDLRVTFWSPSATEQLGWTSDEALGHPELELVDPDDRPRSRETFEALLASPGAAARFVRRQRHKDGSSRLVEVIARNLLLDPAVQGVVANLRDITEQRRLTEQFQQAQKLESIGRLAGGVAHDFNNLLTVILSCSDALREDLDKGTGANLEDVEEIRAAGERARDLTRQLLAFARKQLVSPVALDLNAVVRGNQKMLRRLLGEDVELEVSLQPGLWTMHADPGQVEQVLLNLAVNARDAMARGGRLTIETANASTSAEEAARDPEQPAGEWVRLVVRDSGVGMPPEVRAHLFEPFFTTKGQGKGTGLGLATVYGIVKQAGGHVRVQSEAGRGATFELWFPRVLGAQASAPRQAAPPAARGTEAVLLVEDDPQVREVTLRALKGGGYDVRVATLPSMALDMPSSELSRLRLLITDVVMPGLDGRALADELCRRHPGLRVLFVSGYTQDAIAERGVLDSGVHFLAKPFTGSALLMRVREILDGVRAGA